jgi:spore coat assemly protein
MSFQVGDYVARKSYGADIHFRIVAIDPRTQVADLKGVDMRLCADAPLSDLVRVDEEVRDRMLDKEAEHMSSSVQELKKKRRQIGSYFELPGRVLHMDGDANYLKKCLALYRELEIPVYGIHVREDEMPERVSTLLKYTQPDILVMTGHDAYIKSKGKPDDINAYRHSPSFREAVKKARVYERNRDDLIIFSGACQSHFEGLIQAGANFASAPDRVNIHALDPVYIVEKACYTPIHSIVNLQEVLQYSISGHSGLGGIDSQGTFRTGTPRLRTHEL